MCLYLRVNSLWLRRGGGRLTPFCSLVHRKQKGGFHSCYDMAYVGRDTVNQAAQHVNKLAPELLKQADGILEKRIEDLMLRAGKIGTETN